MYDFTPSAISVRTLTKRYKNGVLANDAIDLDVPAGSIYGLLGPNGAGKTTLVRQLAGELLPTSGEITVAGIDVLRDPIAAKWIMGIVPQEAMPFEVVTVEDHLKVFGRLRGLGVSIARERAEVLMGQLDLLPHRNKQARHLSGGLRRKLLVGIALVAEPSVLILDEPTTGLDPHSRREVWSLIATLRGIGATTLLTTHYMDEAEALCNQVAIIGEGRILARGTIDDVRGLCRNQFKATYQVDGDLHALYGQTQPEVVARLESLGVVEYALGRSSLEDVYLELTGREMEAEANA